MPKLKTNVKGIDRSSADAYAPYDGPEPTPGFYTAVPQSASVKISSGGNAMITTIFKLRANKADNPTKKQFDNYPVWDRVVFSDAEQSKIRLANYLDAMVGDDGADVDCDEYDAQKSGKVNKIGTKKFEVLAGKREVRLLLKRSPDQNGSMRIECEGARPWEPATGVSGTVAQNAVAAKAPVAQRAEAELPGDVDAGDEEADDDLGEDEEDWDRSERLAELNDKAVTLADIRALVTEYELDVKGPRAKLVTAILDHEESLAAEEEEEDEEVDDEQVETDLREELAGLTLPLLRKRAEKAQVANVKQPKQKLIDAIVELELAEPETDDTGAEGSDVLTAESDIADIVAAIVEVDGYSEDDFADYDESNREELVEIAEEEGLLADADEELEAPF